MKAKFHVFGLLMVIAPVFFSLPAAAEEIVTQIKEERLDVSNIDSVGFMNLAGNVTLRRADGQEMIITATLNAAGDTADEARERLALLDLKVERKGNAVKVTGIYPIDDYSSFAYRRDDRSNSWWGSNTTTRYLGERVKVSSRRGLPVHIDFAVAVPDGTSVRFENKVGDAVAEQVNGDLDLDTSSGRIEITGGKGRTQADTGSGSVTVRDRDGNVTADTGSGSVEVIGVNGQVSADTGSGSVDLRRIKGDVLADTGSGSVDLADIEGDVRVDTGSGGVDGVRLSNVTALEIDTGSGSVDLDGDFSGLKRMRIDTGSGGVRMRTTGTLNMQLSVSAGSGGVEVDLPGMTNVQSRRGEFEADIGEAEGRGLIDTGSGGVRISAR
jgi:hypothetical protein